MSIQLRILFGSTVLVALTTFGITLAEAFGPLPGSTSAFVSSINLDGGLSEIETHPNPGNPLQTTVVQSGTISITTYPPLGTMTITTTQRFSGAFPPSPMFDPCSNASGLFFSSTGGTCILNALTQRINCPTGITTFEYSYSCTFVPDVNAGKVSVSLAADWTGSAIDRTWDFSYSPLIYHSAAVPPDLSTSQTLRWTQIDGASVSLDILFVDPRVSLEFLPLVRK